MDIKQSHVCLFEDTPEIAKEKPVSLQTIFDLAEPGSVGYQLIERQKNLCHTMSERQTDDPELDLDKGEPETNGTLATEDPVPSLIASLVLLSFKPSTIK